MDPSTKNGRHLAISPSKDIAGYDAGALDAALRKFVAVGETNVRQCESIQARVEEALAALEGAAGKDAFDTANKVTAMYERLTKANLNVVKATDELSRLRSFLAGGPDRRADLTVMGELDLRAIVMQAIDKLGLKVVEAEVLDES